MDGVEIIARSLQVAVTLSVWISLVAPEVMPDKFTFEAMLAVLQEK